jgi:hypothetical protein
MKEATRRLISNKTTQDKSIRLKDAANGSTAKISNETSQDRSIRFKNVSNRSAAKIPNETLESKKRNQKF